MKKLTFSKLRFSKLRNGIENGKSNTVLERRTLFVSSYKKRKLKVKLWWVGARERNKRAFFVPFIFYEGNSLNISALSQNIHTFTYQKTLLDTLLLLVFKIVERLQCILNTFWFQKTVKARLVDTWIKNEINSKRCD